MICIGTEIGVWVARRYSATECYNWHKTGADRRGFGMTVEKRDQRIVLYLTESEHQALTWAAGRARRRPSDAIRLVAIDWANSQVERAHQERGPA